MRIKRLKLISFRNFTEREFVFSPKNNLIHGSNGSGKTNLLEALFYIGAARSFRTQHDDNLINHNSDFFRLEGSGQIGVHNVTIEIAFKTGTPKLIKVNAAPLPRISQIFEYFRLVEFSPYDLSLVNGSPSVRRRFLSLTISQSEPGHVSVLMEYARTLAQRNALLKTFQGKKELSAEDNASLEVWDEKLAGPALKIHQSRKTFVERISQLAREFYQKISPSSESFHLEYAPSPKTAECSNSTLLHCWLSHRRKEVAWGQTLYGPHRDDLGFSIANLEAKSYASQGQIKCAVLSLRLAQYAYLKERLGYTPVLLLDEMFSDLDSHRLNFIMELLPGLGQVFITTSKLSEINDLDIFDCKYDLSGQD